MASPDRPVGFDEQNAAAYDDRFARISAVRDSLLLQTRALLGDLPDDARILRVGAGSLPPSSNRRLSAPGLRNASPDAAAISTAR